MIATTIRRATAGMIAGVLVVLLSSLIAAPSGIAFADTAPDGTTGIPAGAVEGAVAVPDSLASDADDANEAPSTFTVRLITGDEGRLTSAQDPTPRSSVEWTDVLYDGPADMSDAKVTVTEDSPYYAKLVRPVEGQDGTLPTIAGMVRPAGMIDASGNVIEPVGGWPVVTQPAVFEVEYGLKDRRVAYQVLFRDEAGNDIAGPVTYYGDAGEMTSATAAFVSGYVPDAYAAIKTLSESESNNVLTFTYQRLPEGYSIAERSGGTLAIVTPDGEQVGLASVDNAADDGAEVTTADGTPLLDAEGQAIHAPLAVLNLDEENPLGSDGDSGSVGSPGENTTVAVTATIAFVAILACAIVLWRRRQKQA